MKMDTSYAMYVRVTDALGIDRSMDEVEWNSGIYSEGEPVDDGQENRDWHMENYLQRLATEPIEETLANYKLVRELADQPVDNAAFDQQAWVEIGAVMRERSFNRVVLQLRAKLAVKSGDVPENCEGAW